VAIAWLRDRPSVVAPIASATNLGQLQSLIRGATLRLTAEDIAVLG
jgi:aryl-alcohol dehydrogenase-like predicted oxidoreductase